MAVWDWLVLRVGDFFLPLAHSNLRPLWLAWKTPRTELESRRDRTYTKNSIGSVNTNPVEKYGE